MNDVKPYKDQKLTYSSDGRLLDEYGNAVMMEWERPIMKKSAELVCRNGGKVLNVGFGMGIIDSYIQEQNITEHWIIEPHKDVYKKMFDDGWHLKPKVKILFGDWQWYFKYLPMFDGIYFDTWEDNGGDFLMKVRSILKENGIFSYFNNPREDEKGLHMTDDDFEIITKWGEVEFQPIDLDFIDSTDRQRTDGLIYWYPEWKKYYCPIIKKKNVPYYTF
jgi:protein arginine N-methyltransferase 2